MCGMKSDVWSSLIDGDGMRSKRNKPPYSVDLGMDKMCLTGRCAIHGFVGHTDGAV